MLSDLVGDIVGFFGGLIWAGSAAANITLGTAVGSLDNVFGFLP